MDPIPQEELWRCLVVRAPFAVAVLTPDGKVAEVNGNFLRISGYTRSEAIGQSYKWFVSQQDADSIERELQRLAAGDGEPVSGGWKRLRHKDDSRGAVYLDWLCWRIPQTGQTTHLLLIAFEKSHGSVLRDAGARSGLPSRIIDGLFKDPKAIWVGIALIVSAAIGRLSDYLPYFFKWLEK